MLVKNFLHVFSRTAFFLLTFKGAECIDIGSDPAPARFSTQQTLEDGDRIAGFASLEAGFKLVGSIATSTFDSFFPVSGVVELRFGTLVLQRDLILKNSAKFVSLGDITGNGHTLEFAQSITLVPAGSGSSCVVEALAAAAVQPEDVQSLDWSYDDQFIVIGLGGVAPATPIKFMNLMAPHLHNGLLTPWTHLSRFLWCAGTLQTTFLLLVDRRSRGSTQNFVFLSLIPFFTQ